MPLTQAFINQIHYDLMTSKALWCHIHKYITWKEIHDKTAPCETSTLDETLYDVYFCLKKTYIQ